MSGSIGDKESESQVSMRVDRTNWRRSDIVRRELFRGQLLRRRLRLLRLGRGWLFGGRWRRPRLHRGGGYFGRRRDLAYRPDLGLADLDPRHGMDRLACLGDRLREVAADDAFHELADRLLRGDVGHELRHDRSDDALLRRLNSPVRDRHRLHADVPAVLRHDVDRQVGPRPLAARKPPNVVRCHVMPDELRERVLALHRIHAELEFDVHLAEVARQVLDRDLVDFAFGFIVLIAVWVRYTGSITYLTIETHGVLRLNILMLFLVAIEPYLFNQVFGSLSAPQVDRALANLASAAYAVDLSALMGVLASFEHLASQSPSIPPGSDIANSFLRYRNIHLLVAGVFLISLLPNLESVRTLVWYVPLGILGAWRWLVVVRERRQSSTRTHDLSPMPRNR